MNTKHISNFSSSIGYPVTSTSTTTTTTGGPIPSISQASPIILARQGGKVTTKNLTANVVADKIIDFCNEHGDLVTNLKIQKLLYYAQAWYLALYDVPLFKDELVAWVHGPIQLNLYMKFSIFGSRPIEQPPSNWKVPKKIEKHIQDVMEAYGKFSSYDLERLVCDEEPWREARREMALDDLQTRPINIDTMKRFYAAAANGKT